MRTNRCASRPSRRRRGHPGRGADREMLLGGPVAARYRRRAAGRRGDLRVRAQLRSLPGKVLAAASGCGSLQSRVIENRHAFVNCRPALAAAALLGLTVAAGCMPPSWGANALLHPQRRPMTRQPDRPFDAVEFDGAGVKLKGWWFHAAGEARDGRLPPRRRRQPRVQRRDRGSLPGARLRRHRLRQPRARRVGRGRLHVRLLREAGPRGACSIASRRSRSS